MWPNVETTRSKVASSNGRSCALPSTKSISTIASAARSRAISSRPGAKSRPVTRAPVLAAGIVALPVPQATSRRSIPGSMPARSTTSSPASRIRSATAAKFPASHISLGSMATDYGGLSVLSAAAWFGNLGHMDSIVSAVDIHRRYGEGDAAVDALAGVTVGFERGRFSAIMGPSGSGKSTLMHILAGLDGPTSGTVTLDGEEITGLDDGELTRLRRDKLGFVFQFYNLIPVLTGAENVMLPLSIAGRKPDEEWYRRLIDTVDLGDRLTHRPSELSGGQQQRVAVARALVSRPAVVFADEPTGNLDSRSSEEVLGLLRTAVDEFGQTVVMVTHDPEAASYADRLIVLRDGQVVHDGAAGSADDVIELMKEVA